MSVFQSAYDFFKNLVSPPWLKQITQWLNDNVLMPYLRQLGEQGVAKIEHLIIKASRMDVSGEEKFKYVFTEFKDWAAHIKVTDEIINLCIELLLARLKKQGIVE